MNHITGFATVPGTLPPAPTKSVTATITETVTKTITAASYGVKTAVTATSMNPSISTSTSIIPPGLLTNVTNLYNRTLNRDGAHTRVAQMMPALKWIVATTLVGGIAVLYTGVPGMAGDVPPGENPGTWHTRLRDAGSFLKNAIKSNRRLRKDIARAHHDLEKARSDAALLEQNSAKREPEGLQERLAQLEAEKHTLEGQLAAARREPERLRRQVEEVQARADEHAQQNKALKDRTYQLEAQVAHSENLETKMGDLCEDLEKANKRINELDGLVEKSDKALQDKTTELNKVQQDNVELLQLMDESKELEEKFHIQYQLDSAEHEAELQEHIDRRRKAEIVLRKEVQRRKAAEEELKQFKAQQSAVSAAGRSSGLQANSPRVPSPATEATQDGGAVITAEATAPSSQNEDPSQSTDVSPGGVLQQTMPIPNTPILPPPRAPVNSSTPTSGGPATTASRKRRRDSEQVDNEESARRTKRHSASPRQSESTTLSATDPMEIDSAHTTSVPALDLNNVPSFQRPDAITPTPRARAGSRIPIATPAASLRRSPRKTTKPESYAEASLSRAASPTKARQQSPKKGDGAKGVKKR
jgi:hypothetical protein